VTASFSIARIPKVVFGAGRARELPRLTAGFGGTALVVTGAGALTRSNWDALHEAFQKERVSVVHAAMRGEPTPDWVDATASAFREADIRVVIGFGGGSAMDAGKAVSAMLRSSGSVVDFLEGVGTRPHSGLKVPLIAVPTTAGTGSEATKNAVLSRVGPGGFKKSLRHDNFVPDVALIDPELTLSCPPGVSAACGLDAFAQLLEGYVSTKATPFTDALALSGIEALRGHLVEVCGDAAGDVEARSQMAYAAYLSGVVLANAGLGVVHGLAGPVGASHPIPHGVICGLLTAPAIEANVQALLEAGAQGEPALSKYARVGALLTGADSRKPEDCRRGLVLTVREWTSALRLPRLGSFGFKEADIDPVLVQAESKCNPVELGAEELRSLLAAAV